MTIWSRVTVFALALLPAAGCRDASAPQVRDSCSSLSTVWVPDSAAVLAHEYYSGLTNTLRAVLADTQSFTATWAQLYSGVQPKPVRPDVDFGKCRVLVATLGQRMTGGFDIRVDSATPFQGGTAVYITTTAPGQTCFTTQALTQPAELVRLAPPPEPIVFQDRNVVRECQ